MLRPPAARRSRRHGDQRDARDRREGEHVRGQEPQRADHDAEPRVVVRAQSRRQVPLVHPVLPRGTRGVAGVRGGQTRERSRGARPIERSSEAQEGPHPRGEDGGGCREGKEGQREGCGERGVHRLQGAGQGRGQDSRADHQGQRRQDQESRQATRDGSGQRREAPSRRRGRRGQGCRRRRRQGGPGEVRRGDRQEGRQG